MTTNLLGQPIGGYPAYTLNLQQKRQERDALIANPRWGVRETSTNWSTHVYPALEDFKKSTLRLIAWRASEAYAVPAPTNAAT